MTTSPPDFEREPRNWCVTCGKPLYVWQSIYKFPSLYGPAILCSDCRAKQGWAEHATWADVLIGHRDIKRWKK